MFWSVFTMTLEAVGLVGLFAGVWFASQGEWKKAYFCSVSYVLAISIVGLLELFLAGFNA